MKLSEIIKTYRNENKVSTRVLAERVGCSNAYISLIENDRVKSPTLDIISKLAAAMNMDIEGLLKIMDDTADYRTSNPFSKYRIPVLGKVIAGIPIEAIEEIIDYEEIDSKMAATGEFFALQIKGDSMEPRMMEGDIVIVRKQDSVESGDIAIVLVNGDEATVKKIKLLNNGIMLLPNNPKYEPWIYSAEECDKLPVKIIGKVVECRQKY